MTSIPPLSALSDQTQLDTTLSLLLEPSPILHTLLVPSVHAHLNHPSSTSPPTATPKSYSEVLDICQDVINAWSWEDKARFLGGHPLIGEVKGLSAMSQKEQGGVVRTPKVVLDRLAHLNKLYTKVYPGLPYITFVAGRPRSAIVTEIETVLNLPLSPRPLSDNFAVEEPGLSSEEVESRVREWGGKEWKGECERALLDVFKIAKARLGGMGLGMR